MADRETLKSYFETGDEPTQAQFTELIDSLATVDEKNDVETKADDAQAAAEAAAAKTYKAMVRAQYNSTTATWAIQVQHNVASITNGGTVTNGRIVRVTFTAALGSTLYVPIAMINLNGGNAQTRNVTHLSGTGSMETTHLDLAIADLNTSTVLNLVIF